MLTGSWMRCLLLVLGPAAWLVPAHLGMRASGLALSPADLALLGLVVWAALALPMPRTAGLAAIASALVVATLLGVGAVLVPPVHGLTASYWAHPAPEGQPERSLDFPMLRGATRVQSGLDLRGEAFRVDFINDASRFNFGPDVQPGRDALPFALQLDGWLMVPSDGARTIALQANGQASVAIDERQIVTTNARFGGLTEASGVELTRGMHRLRVTYGRPAATVPRLMVSWDRTPGAGVAPIDPGDLRMSASEMSDTVRNALGAAARALQVVTVGAWVAIGVRAAARTRIAVRPLLGLVPLAFLAHGLVAQAPLFDRTTVLSGLDDWLIYESSARDIVLHGLLMDGGQGHAAPFYGQPLYPYVLALAHWLTGESLFGPLVLQFAALGVLLVGTFVLAARAFGHRLDGLVALAALWLFIEVQPEYFKVARQLFNENLYMPLVVASLVVVVGFARRPRAPALWRCLLAGVLLGLTAISRSQFLLFVPLGALILLIAWRAQRLRAVLAVAAILAGVALAIAPVTARNLVVSGQLVLISSSGGASLLEFHRPPAGLIDPASLASDPLFNALHLDTQTRTVLAFARKDPGGYFATLQPLGAHTVGLIGRNDPGVYWPLFTACVLYVLSFGVRATRRLHVWPIHAFVATHLLVLMLFEADTYGYRLVMPMYAPLIAVAAQVPLALVRSLIGRVRRARSEGQPSADPPMRFAVAGWAVVCVLAGVLQARSVVETWSQREPLLHGLGGPAAHAAQTADASGAEQIFVASVDGTPRRFGAGSLTGLRYPAFRWFDPSRSVPLPDAPMRAVYMLSELAGQNVPGDLTGCLGPTDAASEVVVDGDQARLRCAADVQALEPAVTFDGLAHVDAIAIPPSVEAGRPLETRLLWHPLVARPEPHQFSLQLDDPDSGDDTQSGNGTLDVYPAAEWMPGETILSRIPVATDPTAIPGRDRLTIGLAPTRAGAPAATAHWNGATTTRVPIAQVAVQAGSLLPDGGLPAGVQPVEGAPLVSGGLELLGVRTLPEQASIGGPLKVGLVWRVANDQPTGGQLSLRLIDEGGSVVQEAPMPSVGARIAQQPLRSGNVVRDDRTIAISARAPTGRVWLEVATGSGSTRVGSLTLTGRGHTLDTATPALATFGQAIDVLASSVEPAHVKAGGKVTVKVRWRAAAEMQQAYKVFVHVLSADGSSVVAQRDAEPQDGRAPTTAWVAGEVIEDEYAIALPASLAAGQYPIEIGVYDPRGGARLSLANGDNRLILPTTLASP